MPVNHNNAGTAESSIPYVNQSGTPVECNVYVNQSGTAVLVHEVSTGTITVHDDFESYASTTELRNTWSPSSFLDLVTSGAPEGSQAMTSNDTQTYGARPDLTTNDDETWSIIVEFTDSTASTAGLLSHIQDTSNGGTILDDCLRARLDLQDEELDIQVYENGSFQTQVNPSAFVSLTTGVPYRIEITFSSGDGQIYATVHNDDTEETVVEGILSYNPAWTSGSPGAYFQDSAMANADVLKHDAVPKRLIENFEISPRGIWASSDLFGTGTVWTQTVGSTNYSFNTTDAIIGDRCVEMDSTGDWNLYVSEPGDGVSYYPAEGDIFGGYMMEHDPGAQCCLGWYASGGDGYTIQLGTEGVSTANQFQFRRWDNGGTTAIGDTISSSSLSQDTWYWIEVELQSGGNYVARLYDVNQTTGALTNPDSPIHEITATDTTHTANEGVIVGNRATNGMGRYDDIRKVGEV